MSRLSISDEVRDTLPTAAIERAIVQRGHTELICVQCGGTVAPESPEPASVLVGFDEQGTAIVRFAHDACAPSHVDRAAPWTMSTEPRLSYVPILRSGRVAAVLVWERNAVALDARGQDATAIAAYGAAGFVASDDGIATVRGPTLKDWVLEGDRDRLVLRRGPRPVEEFDRIAAVAPSGWLAAARGERRCLLVVGETLGLDRPDPERIDALLADGRAVAAIVLAKISRV